MSPSQSELPWVSPSRFLDQLDRLWLISDTHWGHRRLREVLAPGIRPAHVDALMVQRWWETVALDDPVLHSGGVFMGDIEAADVPDRFPTLPGNHDGSDKLASLAAIGWLMVEPFAFEHEGWTVRFSQQPLEDLADGELNVHGHIHQNSPPTARHFNASVERIDYRPVLLKHVLDQLIEASGGARKWGAQRAAPRGR
ncbi:MAG: metallophosphoesterase family protein [Candidatus Dormibacteria bacterium]